MPDNTDGPCCWLGLCCPPAEQAAALAVHFGGLDPNYARRIVDEVEIFVPRIVARIEVDGDPIPVDTENERLNALHDYVKSELAAILEEAGHSSKAEG